MKINNRIFTLTSSLILALSFMNNANAISKCRDDSGKWHYGDSVSHLCKTNKITKMNDRGVVKEEIARKKSDNELAKEQSELSELERRKAKKKEAAELERYEKSRVLGSYESESDIEKIRGEKLKAFEQRKEMFTVFLNYLDKKKAMLQTRKASTKSVAAQNRIDDDLVKLDKEINSTNNSKDNIGAEIVKINEQLDRELALFRKFTKASQ